MAGNGKFSPSPNRLWRACASASARRCGLCPEATSIARPMAGNFANWARPISTISASGS
ncbi:hypothetical protein D3C73_847590 [compost metagenome]